MVGECLTDGAFGDQVKVERGRFGGCEHRSHGKKRMLSLNYEL